MGKFELENAMLECRRDISRAQARQLRAIAALASGSEFDAPQIALLMRWSPHRAADQLALATRMTDVLPASLDALEAGAIDLYKMESISDLTLSLTPEQAREVEAKALSKAPEQTAATLRQRLRRLVARVDPEGAAERAAAKKTDRYAALIPDEDDMVKAYVYLCADKALAIKAGSTSSPHWPRSPAIRGPPTSAAPTSSATSYSGSRPTCRRTCTSRSRSAH